MVRRYALFAVAIGFCCGALLRSLFSFGLPVLGFVLMIALVLYAAWLSTRVPQYALAVLFAMALMLGAGRAMLVPSGLPPTLEGRIGAEASLEGTIDAEPDIRETSQRIIVGIEDGGEETRVLAVVPLYPELAYGERVRVAGILEHPEPFETEGGRTFAYDDYLAKDGVFAYFPRATVERVAPSSHAAAAFNALTDAKHAFVGGLEAALPEPHAGLASGILVGGKQGLGRDLYDAFIAAGLVHIVVLSGYNVMLVASALSRATRRAGTRWSNALAATSILAFVLAAGAGSASVRAGLMAALALYARSSGRRYDALRALGAVVLLMLAWNPFLLAFDAGFQFSIAATVGLIVGTPITERWLAFVRSGFLREVLATTVAAQIGVLPILLYQTGMLSPYALIANALVLPVVPLAMFLSFVAALFGMAAPFVAPIAGLPAYALLSYLMQVAELIARLPYADAVLPAFSFAFVALAYAVLLLGAVSAQRGSPVTGSNLRKE